MDGVQYLHLDEPEYAADLHEQCEEKGHADKCDCTCHTLKEKPLDIPSQVC